jgi:hypothetical protein
MNSIIRDYYPVFEMYQALRNQLLEILTDEDLSYRAGGANPTLGFLCREIGETEQAYIQSFKTFTMQFVYGTADPALENSVSALAAWYAALDRDLKQAVEALSDEDIQQRHINRGGDFKLRPAIQLNVYQEALLIFYGKASVYLKAMGKTLPKQWEEWIG